MPAKGQCRGVFPPEDDYFAGKYPDGNPENFLLTFAVYEIKISRCLQGITRVPPDARHDFPLCRHVSGEKAPFIKSKT